MRRQWIEKTGVAVLIIAFIAILGMMTYLLGRSIEITEPVDQTEPIVIGTEIVNRRISADNTTYELLYKTTYSNGLSVSQWQKVDWDDFIRLWEER